jgi:hypothetical protein
MVLDLIPDQKMQKIIVLAETILVEMVQVIIDMLRRLKVWGYNKEDNTVILSFLLSCQLPDTSIPFQVSIAPILFYDF